MSGERKGSSEESLKKTAREIAEIHGYDQVVVVGRKCGVGGYEEVVGFGSTEVHRAITAKMIEFVKRKMLGWEQA